MNKINWDKFGIGASLACAVHCAVLPLVFTSLPFFGFDIVHSFLFEIFMIALAFCIGFFSLRHGRKHHGQFLPTYIFTAGMFCLFMKEIFIREEIFFLVPAVILIVTAHSFNFFASRKPLMKGK